jgi:hypothetical protein
MEILEQIKEHDCTDFEFLFGTGPKLTISVDHDSGDTWTELDDRYVIEVTEKPSLGDPDEMVDAETLIVHKANLAAVSIRKRKQRMPTEEEKLQTKKFMHQLLKTVQ